MTSKSDDDAPTADENVVNQIAELLMAARAGKVVGFVTVCFMQKGDVNVLVAGEQSLTLQLGALDIAKDGCKVYATQKVLAKQPVGWGPGSTQPS